MQTTEERIAALEARSIELEKQVAILTGRDKPARESELPLADVGVI